MPNRIVKRAKHTEHYQRDKLHASVHAVCLSVRELAGSAELTATHVCNHVEEWLEDKVEVTSADIRRMAALSLKIYNPHAASLYAAHIDIN